jgi:ParB family transcriptional regulator, chromosome partitioning protein
MDQQDTILEVEISRITVNRYQPRRQFSQEELQELAQSIKTVGIIHPPLVRPSEEGNYELVSGERRLRAAIRFRPKPP